MESSVDVISLAIESFFSFLFAFIFAIVVGVVFDKVEYEYKIHKNYKEYKARIRRYKNLTINEYKEVLWGIQYNFPSRLLNIRLKELYGKDFLDVMYDIDKMKKNIKSKPYLYGALYYYRYRDSSGLLIKSVNYQPPRYPISFSQYRTYVKSRYRQLPIGLIIANIIIIVAYIDVSFGNNIPQQDLAQGTPIIRIIGASLIILYTLACLISLILSYIVIRKKDIGSRRIIKRLFSKFYTHNSHNNFKDINNNHKISHYFKNM